MNPSTTPSPPDGGPGDDLPAVAPRLRDLRRHSGLTLEAAAGRVGLSPAHLSRLETGRRTPSLPMLLALARTYGTTVSDLLGEVPPPSATRSCGASGWNRRRPVAGRTGGPAAPGGRCRRCGCAYRRARAARRSWCGCTRARSGCTSPPAGCG
ncbi:helix-turn-helix domain-containing protein [Streptomyces sp. ISL-11]|uniref:helix-turn-helix domain-containing protein n=1 Tax=Streptomyces sp. ISL-11 TaxID=2819174 RepID=UPI002034D59A|nr:helix-turn-helix transcriptional regulator [Streptomyces sp. ISL-11]